MKSFTNYELIYRKKFQNTSKIHRKFPTKFLIQTFTTNLSQILINYEKYEK